MQNEHQILPGFYTELFNAITDAISFIESENPSSAAERLRSVRAQQIHDLFCEAFGKNLVTDEATHSRMYLILWDGTCAALRLIERGEAAQAAEKLRDAQLDAENVFIECGEPDQTLPSRT